MVSSNMDFFFEYLVVGVGMFVKIVVLGGNISGGVIGDSIKKTG